MMAGHTTILLEGYRPPDAHMPLPRRRLIKNTYLRTWRPVKPKHDSQL